MQKCNGCKLKEYKWKLGKKFLLMPGPNGGVYELDAEPIEGQGHPKEYNGRPLRFCWWGMSYGHSDECYDWHPPRKKIKKKKKKQEFNQRRDLMSDYDIDELSRQIRGGCTSGHLADEDGKRIYWELKINVWMEK